MFVLVLFLSLLPCRADSVVDGPHAIVGEDGVKRMVYWDDEEKVVIRAAVKEARRLGYNVKKYRIDLFMHGHDSTVRFCLPNTDTSVLTIGVRSNTGKIFHVEELKKKKG